MPGTLENEWKNAVNVHLIVKKCSVNCLLLVVNSNLLRW